MLLCLSRFLISLKKKEKKEKKKEQIILIGQECIDPFGNLIN